MNEKDMQHGINWNGHNITGYIATEKYDGCRAYWDGEHLWSRGGLQINVPDLWRAALPKDLHLDGEIYDGIDGVYRCGSAIKYGRFTPSMKFMVFDCPTVTACYLDRIKCAKQYESGPVKVVNTRIIFYLSDAKQFLNEVHSRGGEGLILRNPKLKYTAGRTSDLIKLKCANRRTKGNNDNFDRHAPIIGMM